MAAFSIAELSDIDDAAAAQCVTDGSGDNGIDAIYYDAAERNCLLVQAKWVSTGNGSVEVGDVHKFVQGVKDLLEAKFERFNSKVSPHKDKIFSALSDATARFTLVLAYTGEQSLSADARAPFEDLLSEMNSPSEVMSLRVLNQAELHKIVAAGATGDSVDLEIMLHQWGMLQSPYLAYYGQVALADIASWGHFGTELTAKNLRQFRGLTEVNESIAKTLVLNSDRFWYFNNGITVLCESLRKKPLGGPNNETGTFECRGASVVNGAQTVGTIVDISNSNPGVLGNGRVLVRLVSLEECPAGFGDDLTRAMNTQNRIEKRDFAALDPNQKRLRTELFLEHQKEYAYQTGEQPPSGDAGCTLDEAAIALACAKDDVTLAVQAKREVGMLYEDIAKPPYITIFNASTTAKAMWHAVNVLRICERQLRKEQEIAGGKEKLIAIHGNRFVLHMVFHILRAKWPNSLPDPSEFSNLIMGATHDSLLATVQKASQHYSGAYPASLFKNASKCRELKESVAEALEAVPLA